MTAITMNRRVEPEKNPQAKSVLEAVVNVWTPSRGVSDGLAATTRTANLLSQTVIPNSDWLKGVKSGAASARSWMSPFYFPITLKKFSDKSSLRNGMDMVSAGFYAGDAILSQKIVGDGLFKIAATIKTGVDAIDCYSAVNELVDVVEVIDKESVDGKLDQLKNKRTNLIFRVLKCALAVISGIGTILASIFGVVLSYPVAIAFLAASVASIIFGMTGDFHSQAFPLAKIVAN